MKKPILYCLFLYSLLIIGQSNQVFIIKGEVTDKYTKKPMKNVNVFHGEYGTITNKKGVYTLRLKINKTDTPHMIASHQGYKNDTTIISNDNKIITIQDIELEPKSTSLIEVDLISEESRQQGVTKIDPKILAKLPGSSGGIEPIVKLLPGVSSNNELSSQYSVRGGNYDENLIYVNGIQIYKPFLVRTGEQEGLSFVNPNMIASIEFSSGGFQAKFGDKLSSVLNIKYKKPIENNLFLSTSLLGFSINAEGIISKTTNHTHTISYLLAGRMRSTDFLLKSLDTK